MKIFTIIITLFLLPAYLFSEDELSTPQLILPEHQAELKIVRPVFTWYSVPNAKYYRIQITTDVTFRDINTINSDVDADFIEDTTVVPNANLRTDTMYFWRVQAKTYDNDNSEWSDIRRFETPKQGSGGIFSDDYANKIYVRCFPQPITNAVNITINFDKSQSIGLYLFDYSGKLLEKLCDVPNNFVDESQEIRINFDKFISGNYSLFFINEKSQVLAIKQIVKIADK